MPKQDTTLKIIEWQTQIGLGLINVLKTFMEHVAYPSIKIDPIYGYLVILNNKK